MNPATPVSWASNMTLETSRCRGRSKRRRIVDVTYNLRPRDTTAYKATQRTLSRTTVISQSYDSARHVNMVKGNKWQYMLQLTECAPYHFHSFRNFRITCIFSHHSLSKVKVVYRYFNLSFSMWLGWVFENYDFHSLWLRWVLAHCNFIAHGSALPQVM